MFAVILLVGMFLPDIKPSNMLVSTQGFVKLCDFGVSVQLLTSLTKTFIGTNAYMAVSHMTDHVIYVSSHVISYSRNGFWVVNMEYILRYGVWDFQH